MKNLLKKLFKKHKEKQNHIVYKDGKIYKFNDFNKAIEFMMSNTKHI